MLTHTQISMAAKLQYQIETRTQGTFFGAKIGGGPDCSYDPNQIPKPLTPTQSELEKEAQKP